MTFIVVMILLKGIVIQSTRCYVTTSPANSMVTTRLLSTEQWFQAPDNTSAIVYCISRHRNISVYITKYAESLNSTDNLQCLVRKYNRRTWKTLQNKDLIVPSLVHSQFRIRNVYLCQGNIAWMFETLWNTNIIHPSGLTLKLKMDANQSRCRNY